MEEKLIIESLSPMEKNVLPKLDMNNLSVEYLCKINKLDKTTVLRAINFLEKKGLVDIESSEIKKVDLGILGINYLKKELPERALLNKLNERGSIPMGEIRNVCGLNENEAKVAFGILKKKALVNIDKGKIKLIAKGSEVSKKMIEEVLIEKLPINIGDIKDMDALALDNLKKRKDIIEIIEKKIIDVRLTTLGLKISKMDLGIEMLEALTPKMLKGTSWKGKKFRRYDLNAATPRIYGGKRHFVNQATDYAKSIWLEMGFEEMKGNMIETGFWVFDSLFTAQDHPVREMQDTFYLKGLTGRVPSLAKKNVDCILSSVKKAHEGGWMVLRVGNMNGTKITPKKSYLEHTRLACLLEN